MQEISLHILDIIQNSIVAGASLIRLELTEDTDADVLSFTVTDNGKGMSPEMTKKVIDPFTTGRTTRKVGLGIPLLKAAAESTGGGIELSSRIGEGTVVSARFGYGHIDRQPLGDMAETMVGLITSHSDIDFVYTHRFNDKEYSTDTREIKKILGDVRFDRPEIMLWLSEYFRENETELYTHG